MSNPSSEPGPPHDDLHEVWRNKRRLWAGIGIPTIVAGIVAGLLGIPWWIILLFCAVVLVGMVLNG